MSKAVYRHLSQPSRLVRLVGTLLALALMVYLLGQQGWGEILAAIRQISPWRFALAFALMIISRLAVAARWHTLLRSADVQVTFTETLRLTFAGLFASNFLPTTVGGDVIRLVGSIQHKHNPVVSAASLVVDRLVGMLGMSMLLPFSFPAISSELSKPASAFLPFLAQTVLPKQGWTQKALSRARAGLEQLYTALKLWLSQPRALLVALAFTWVHMICLFTLIQILLAGMGESLSFWLIGGLYSLVYFITLLPFSINGYGLQEFSMTMIFTNLGRAPMGAGLIIALLFRTLMMTASLPGVLSLPDILSATRDAPTQP
jgi:uncharacterized membrane protein YbhN (UPF0104 family)